MPLQFRTAKRWVTKRVTPDYTNQLDLFSEAAMDTAVPSDPVRTSGFSHPRPRPQQLHFLEWVPLPPEDDVRSQPAEQTAPATTDRDGGTVHPTVRPPDIAAQDGISPTIGTGEQRDPF